MMEDGVYFNFILDELKLMVMNHLFLTNPYCSQKVVWTMTFVIY